MTDPTPLDPRGEHTGPPAPLPPFDALGQVPAPSPSGPTGPSFHEAVTSPPAWRIILVAIAGVALLVSAAVVLGASPSPSADSNGAAAQATTVPGDAWQGTDLRGLAGRAFAGFGLEGRGHGGPGRYPITISAISGSSVSLKTEDGWTRTITITSSTTLTKGGQTITLTDLKVGDTVRFQETRNSNGTFTITALQVVVPTVSGSVTAVSDSGFTLKARDGTTWAVSVSSATSYTLGAAGTSGSKSDVKVGSDAVVQGTQGSGNTLTALSVRIRLPRTAGEVTAKTGSTITIKRFNGTTQTIKVGSGTTYHVAGVSNPTLANITVGMGIVAEGTQNSDGSLSATSVSGGVGLRGFPKGPWAPAPSSSPSTSGSNG